MSDLPAPVSHAKPTPTPGQIWRLTLCGPLEGDGSVIERIVDTVAVFNGGQSKAPIDSLLTLPHWQCIGIDTPHGRVMVGERRDIFSEDRVATVQCVLDGARVQLGGPGLAPFARPAHIVAASWPVVTERDEQIRAAAEKVAVATGIAASDVVHKIRRLGDKVRRNPHFFSDLLGRDECARVVATGATTTPEQLAETVRAIAAEYRAHHPWERVIEIAEEPVAKRMPMPEANAAYLRAEREQRRSEIDAALREDARRFPAFAEARQYAVMAACERHGPFANQIGPFLADLRTYETARSRGMLPARARQEIDGIESWGEHGCLSLGLAAYERARSLS